MAASRMTVRSSSLTGRSVNCRTLRREKIDRMVSLTEASVMSFMIPARAAAGRVIADEPAISYSASQ